VRGNSSGSVWIWVKYWSFRVKPDFTVRSVEGDVCGYVSNLKKQFLKVLTFLKWVRLPNKIRKFLEITIYSQISGVLKWFLKVI
jgi:hypothetical protein